MMHYNQRPGKLAEATSFRGEGDIVVKELAKLHGHVGETLRAQFGVAARCVHCIRHIARTHSNLSKRDKDCSHILGLQISGVSGAPQSLAFA